MISKKTKLKVLLYIILTFLLVGPALSEDKKRLALFTPRRANDAFWGVLEHYMQEACRDLGMELQVFHARENHLTMVKQVKMALKMKFDAVVVPNYKERLTIITKLANSAQIPIFTYNAGFAPSSNMGEPRQKYQYWIGEILPDDEGAGYNLAKTLIKEAKKRAMKLEMIAFLGIGVEMASRLRMEGLHRFLKDHPNVKLHQYIPANWERTIAGKKAKVSIKRYPDAKIYWSASDEMALGILDAIEDQGIITGGVDWSKQGINAVNTNKQMIASMGGHIYEGAWAAVLIYDYLHGKDFKEEGLRIKSHMHGITKKNVKTFLKKLTKSNSKNIDFSKFSKVKNPSLKKYDFSLEALLKQL